MKAIPFFIRNILFLALFTTLYTACTAQQKEPWTPKQLIEPAALAGQLKLSPAERPVVIDIGPAGVIAGAEEVGPAEDKENLAKMKALLQKVPKDKEVVIYCGCCPFARCPNVRPAFTLLKTLGYTNARLLNLTDNLKADWIDKGYPLAEQ